MDAVNSIGTLLWSAYRQRVDDIEIIRVYNLQGRKAVNDLVSDKYGVAYPHCVLSRLRGNSRYGYDKIKDQFNLDSENAKPFLELDELCIGTSLPESQPFPGVTQDSIKTPKAFVEEYETLLQALAREKLMGYTKFIQLDVGNRICRIDRKMLKANGYQLEIYLRVCEIFSVN